MNPIYIKVKKKIQDKINEGIYKAGEKIPSERELAKEYGVSRMTARQAVEALSYEKTVYRERGKGTFVAAKQFSQKNVKSFTQTLAEQGYEPSTVIIEFSIVRSLKEISRKMELPAETEYYKLKRLRLGNNIPIALETVYIPVQMCPMLEQPRYSLYDELERKYGYIVERVSNDIDACISTRPMMELFQLQKPKALLKIKGVSYTTEGEALFYEESYYRSDLYRYQVDIYKRR